MNQLQIAVLIFLTVFIVLRGLASLLTKDKEEIAQRVATFTRDNRTQQEDKTDSGEKGRPLLNILRILTPQKMLDKAEQELLQTDILLRPEELVFMQIGAVIFPFIFSLLIFENIGLAVLLSVLGVIAPSIFIKNAKLRRQKRFNEQLGDALSIMSNSLKAGFSFLQTLDSLQKEMGPPLSTEFNRALREMRLGTTTDEALYSMTKRVRSDDLELIVTAVNIQRQVGGNLAEILDNIAFTIKERLRIKGEVKTLTAQGRISGVIVGALPMFLAIIIFITNPSYMASLFKNPIGYFLIGGAIISELIGASLIKKIVDIEY